MASPNPRASLLSGLRTGGVRATSVNIPQTAGPGGHFTMPRFASVSQHHSNGFSEEEEDQMGEMPAYGHYASNAVNRPMTAGVDGTNNKFSQQQTGGQKMNPNSATFIPGFGLNIQSPAPDAQAQAMQEMQLLQMEVIRLQVS